MPRSSPPTPIARATPKRWSAPAENLEVSCLGCEGDGPPAHELLGLPQPIDLRWTVLHLIEETAHHAGHADATREMLDGTRADELLRRVRRRTRT